jgi:hypothetical protein
MLDQYRDALGDFQTNLTAEWFLYHSGQRNSLELHPIYDRFADLFTLDAIKDLQRQLESTSEYFARKRKGIRLLIAFAEKHHLEQRVHPLTEQLARTEKQATLRYGRDSISYYAALDTLATESDALKRRQLHQQRLDWIAQTNDLRQERLAEIHTGAQALGHTHYWSMMATSSQADLSSYADLCARVLQETESLYFRQLERVLPRALGMSRAQADHADLAYFLRLPGFARQFPEDGVLAVYHETLKDLGINLEKKTNIGIDAHQRSGKHPEMRSFPIHIPDEIKISACLRGGPRNYQRLLHEAGRAQSYAWTSAALPIEFKLCGDPAVSEGFGFLFEYLTLDPAWLEEMLHVVKSDEFISFGWLQKLLLIRSSAATLPVARELHSTSDWNAASRQYAQQLTEATGFRHNAEAFLDDLDHDVSAVHSLRGWLFEVQLREYLKTRFGKKWWTSKKAADALIDLWSSGGEYTVEELASLADLGSLSLDHLISEFALALKNT